MKQNEILIHNIAGELASLYVKYLARFYPTGGDKYFRDNWLAEYASRKKIMETDPDKIKVLNGYNDFFNVTLACSETERHKFYYEPKK
jgi:hypothetical protein